MKFHPIPQTRESINIRTCKESETPRGDVAHPWFPQVSAAMLGLGQDSLMPSPAFLLPHLIWFCDSAPNHVISCFGICLGDGQLFIQLF